MPASRPGQKVLSSRPLPVRCIDALVNVLAYRWKFGAVTSAEAELRREISRLSDCCRAFEQCLAEARERESAIYEEKERFGRLLRDWEDALSTVRLKDDQLRQENLLLTLRANNLESKAGNAQGKTPRSGSSQICFMHLPKTAGTSIRSYLRELFPAARCFQGADWAFDLVTAADLAQFDLIMGHFSFRHTQKFCRGHKLITFIREPVERVVSGYFFMRDMPDDVFTSKFEKNVCSAAKTLPLMDFLQSQDPSVCRFVRNQQSRAIADDDRELGSSDEALVERATANSKHFFYVGTADQLVEGASSLCQLLGANNAVALRHLNKTGARPHSDDISSAERQLIAELNSADIHLYPSLRAGAHGHPSSPVNVDIPAWDAGGGGAGAT